MNLGQKATASYPGALFDLDDDKPSKDPLSELLKSLSLDPFLEPG
jgi:hypothetical protein